MNGQTSLDTFGRVSTATKAIRKTELKLRNPDKWEKIADTMDTVYEAETMHLADRWGRLMQHEIAAGKLLEDIVEKTFYLARLCSGEANTALAQTILAQTWVHGEQLQICLERPVRAVRYALGKLRTAPI